MSDWKDFRQELLANPDVKQAYDARAVERALARAVLNQRLAKQVTQKEMAQKMCVPQGNISRLESGSLTPTISTLQKAAKALGVPLEIRFGDQVVFINRGQA